MHFPEFPTEPAVPISPVFCLLLRRGTTGSGGAGDGSHLSPRPAKGVAASDLFRCCAAIFHGGILHLREPGKVTLGCFDARRAVKGFRGVQRTKGKFLRDVRLNFCADKFDGALRFNKNFGDFKTELRRCNTVVQL